MTTLKTLRKELNPQQKALRKALKGKDGNRDEALPLFLELHGILHSAQVAPDAPWSYEDLLFDGLANDVFREIPEGGEHSLIWLIWHLSRIEDITMNLLVAGGDQLFERDGWQAKIKAPFKHTCNGTGLETVEVISAAVDVPALFDYRHAVGRATREVVQALTPDDFTRKMEPARLQRIKDEGALVEVGYGAADYWGRQNVAGLLLMPPTRHIIIHWNEARQIIQKLT